MQVGSDRQTDRQTDAGVVGWFAVHAGVVGVRRLMVRYWGAEGKGKEDCGGDQEGAVLLWCAVVFVDDCRSVGVSDLPRLFGCTYIR